MNFLSTITKILVNLKKDLFCIVKERYDSSQNISISKIKNSNPSKISHSLYLGKRGQASAGFNRINLWGHSPENEDYPLKNRMVGQGNYTTYSR